MEELVSYLQRIGVLKSPYLIRAFRAIDRADFVPRPLQSRAYEDDALPIGHGQTISQPYTVAFMLELLDPRPGETMLDVGAGSGWQTALLAHVAAQDNHRGRIYALERVPELCELARKHLAAYENLKEHISLFCRNAEHLPKTLPGAFHKIICAAELKSVPQDWQERLCVGGVLVFPQEGNICRWEKKKNGSFKKEAYPGFAFVPFITGRTESVLNPSTTMQSFSWPSARFLRVTRILGYRILLPVFFFALLSFYALAAPPGAFPSGTIVRIESGETLAKIATRLKEKQIIRSPRFFQLLARLLQNDTMLQAGDYFFEKPLSVISILNRLRGEDASPHVRLTVIEGYTLYDIAELFEELGFFEKTEFFSVTGTPASFTAQKNMQSEAVDFAPISALVKERPEGATLEGYLFPDTYFFSPNARPEDIAGVMIKNFDKQIDNDLRTEIAESGRSFFEVLTMASLLEKEAVTFRDRQIVAGILWKRLDAGMPLQVDASLSYAHDRASLQLTKDDLESDSPYNTYRNKGLPFGPIANPGIGALRAAVRLIRTPYWFYLSDRQGNMHYATDFEEHKQNKFRYLR